MHLEQVGGRMSMAFKYLLLISTRRNAFIVLTISYLILFLFEINSFPLAQISDTFAKYLLLILMPTGYNFYTGPLIATFLAIDLAIDCTPPRFEVVTLPLHLILKIVLILLLIIHTVFIVFMVYFMQKGGF